MSVIRDVLRLMKAGLEQSAHTDYAENLRLSADLAEQYTQGFPATHGAAGANPFTNMAAMDTWVRGSGRVIGLTPTGQVVAGTAVYAVDFEVTVEGRTPYRATYQTVIAPAALHNWQPDALLPVRVDPANPQVLMLG
jgi:hypothetical protein